MTENLNPAASLRTILRIKSDGTFEQVRMCALVAGDLIHVIERVNEDYTYYGKWQVSNDATLENGADGFDVWGCEASLIFDF